MQQCRRMMLAAAAAAGNDWVALPTQTIQATTPNPDCSEAQRADRSPILFN